MEHANLYGKVIIIGCGFVGASAAYTLALDQQVSEIVLIDENADKARGHALDICHGLPLIGMVKVRAGEFEDVKDAQVIIIAAGSGRKPGESRLDLLKKNHVIMSSITLSIMKHYNGGVILVISNPVDILTYIIQKESGLPMGRVFGSGTMLDTMRFRHHISEQLKINSTAISGVMIGEHGESVVPVWSTVNIQGIPLENYCATTGATINKSVIEQDVLGAGARVIQFKGATYYAIAVIIGHLVDAVLRNENVVLPVSSCIDGPFGIRNVALSLLSVVNSNGVEVVLEMEINDSEKEKLLTSSSKLKKVISEL
jgi:L-lactate dehydrogenase